MVDSQDKKAATKGFESLKEKVLTFGFMLSEQKVQKPINPLGTNSGHRLHQTPCSGPDPREVHRTSEEMRTTARLILCLLGCLVLSPGLEGTKTQVCPNGWLHFRHKCYGYFKETMTWANAEVECQNYRPGAHLVSILNEAETNVLARYISTNSPAGNVWIGLHDACRNRKWQWTDSSISNYKAWAPGEPNNWKGNERCAELLASSGYKLWNDVSCKISRGFICKYQL
ncbi:C-type lectin lectoxin-Thr1-like [Alligator mississippiensis]|uniref:C-type lectin lectoxin-Thr1-like n=1 Tax=Alligator mississippiensis TaxID=8496 RepID=UPI0028772DAA|nr:C-type lectin lectoxin-Thr1-like [Alligator mississippiensis]